MADEVDDKVIGVGVSRAALIAEQSVGTLAQWERIGLVVPEFERRTGRILRVYGMSELVELRIVSMMLEQKVSVANIRRVVEAHRSHNIAHPLRSLGWCVDAGKIYVQFEDGTWAGGKQPRQNVMAPQIISLEPIRARIRSAAQNRRDSDRGRIERRRRTMGHRPVFAGTRTPVSAVLAYLDRGHSDEDILKAYPHLSMEDIAAARKERPAIGA